MSKSIRQAVSVIFSHKDQIFVIKRQNHLRSFPGYLAFIGGKVDKEDYEVNSLNAKFYKDHPIHLINALIREVNEETKLDITKIDSDNISFLGQAISPDFNPVRFNTYFFQIELSQKNIFELDEYEIEKGWWSTPKQIINEWSSGEYLIVPPIKYFIENLKSNNQISYERTIDKDKVPYIETISDLIQYMPLSNTLPPATRTNCFYINGDVKIIVDPSPKDDLEMKKLLNSFKAVDKILITHYHRDHYERVDLIARSLSVPVIMTKDTHELIVAHRGDNYFDEIELEFVSDLEAISSWKGEEVIIYEVYGHARGHIAIAPSSLRWFIAGDLFQGVGSVVVGGENASMSEYFKSLQRVIDLNPSCVIPSHGIALGGVEIIKKNLNHRKRREAQIYDLYKLNSDLDELYKKIYFGLDEKLRPYAMANIVSHLDKLEEEARIN